MGIYAHLKPADKKMAEKLLKHMPAEKVAQEWDHFLRRGLKAERLHDHHLLQKTEEYAHRLNIQKPLLYVTEEFPSILGGRVPNAMAIVHGQNAIPVPIIFTREAFNIHNYHLNTSPPNEVLFTLGHEMGHIKQGSPINMRRYPRFIGAAGAVAALYLIDKAIARARKKQKEEAVSDKHIEETLPEVAKEERDKLKALLHQSADSHQLHGVLGGIESTLEGLMKSVEYIAVGLLGHWGGRHVTRQYMLKTELECDRIGAELCGDPRAGIRNLKAMETYVRNMPVEERLKIRRSIGPKEAADLYFDHAHPTHAERIARLEAMAQQMEKGAAKMRNTEVALGSVLERMPALMARLGKSLQGLRIH